MDLYTTSSHSVDNTTDHHIQPEKRHTSMDDNSFSTKRKRLSLTTISESNSTMNTTLLPASCPLMTSSTLPILEQGETKSHNITMTTTTTTTTTMSPDQSESISISTTVQNNDSQHQNTPIVTEETQHTFTQQPKNSIVIHVPLSQHQQQDTSSTTKATESSHQSSTSLQKETVSPPSFSSTSSMSTRSPPILSQQDISRTMEITETAHHHQSSTLQHEPLETTRKTEKSQQSPRKETPESPSTQYEKITISHPSIPTRHDSSSETSQHENIAISEVIPSSPTNQPPLTQKETVPPITTTSTKTTTKGNKRPVLLPTTTLVEGRSKRIRKPVEYNVKEWETFKQVSASSGSGRRRTAAAIREAPRWYTQSYLMFLALREHPDHCLSRSDLIRAALALDEKISKERNLPRVFRSKTPSNSASAILTNNSDRYYVSYKPEGSRCRWFKLAYTPGNFDHAYGEYRKWMDKLINHDWLFCFGVPLENSTPMTQEEIDTITAGSCTALPPADSNNDSTTDNNNNGNNDITTNGPSSTTPSLVKDGNDNNGIITNGIYTSSTTSSLVKDSNNDNNGIITNGIDTSSTISSLVKDNSNDNNGSTEENSETPEDDEESITTNTKLNQVQKIHQPMYRVDQLDLSNVPKKWQDIVCVDTSSIPNSGQGLFAVRELPYNTPLGFYFGVPMTEYEFDSMKETVGRASEYSIKYRKTILDATDEHGEPYTLKNDDDDEPQRLCPFHYMNEAKDIDMANILFVEGVVVNQVICWSKRNIKPGEELLVWYGTDVNRYWKDD